MKTLKVMSIIAIIWSSISFFAITYLLDFDNEAAAGWGILLFLYSLPFSIVVLTHTNKKDKKKKSK